MDLPILYWFKLLFLTLKIFILQLPYCYMEISIQSTKNICWVDLFFFHKFRGMKPGLADLKFYLRCNIFI